MSPTDMISWVGNGPPVDYPKCGFYGEHCGGGM